MISNQKINIKHKRISSIEFDNNININNIIDNFTERKQIKTSFYDKKHLEKKEEKKLENIILKPELNNPKNKKI